MKQSRPTQKEPLPEIVDEKCKRKIKAQQEKNKSIFFGFGMFGVVGWSVAIPTVIATLIGRWLDGQQIGSEKISWTLTCLLAGLVIGSLIAWQWIKKEGGAK